MISNATLGSIESGIPEPEMLPRPEVAPKATAGLPAWLIAKVPDGQPVEQFLDHPLNIVRSRGLAQALRGFTAMFGSLNYAVIDIFVGLFSFTREQRPMAGVGNGGGQNIPA